MKPIALCEKFSNQMVECLERFPQRNLICPTKPSIVFFLARPNSCPRFKYGCEGGGFGARS